MITGSNEMDKLREYLIEAKIPCEREVQQVDGAVMEDKISVVDHESCKYSFEARLSYNSDGHEVGLIEVNILVGWCSAKDAIRILKAVRRWRNET